MGRLILLSALACAGCQAVVAVPDPKAPEGARALLMLDTDAVWASPVIDGELPPFVSSQAQALTAAWFACDLKRLGLSEGRIELRVSGAEASPLPPPLLVQALAAGGWSPREKDEDLELLRRLPLPPEQGCNAVRAHFVAEALPYAFDAQPAFALVLPDGRALIAARNGRAIRIGADAVMEPITLPDRTGAGYVAPDGELWLLGTDGVLHRGRPESGFTAVSSVALGRENVEWVVMSGPDNANDPFELFVASYDSGDNRWFLRYDGQSWARLASARGSNSIFVPGVAWIGPSQALIIGIPSFPPSLTRYDQGELSIEALPFSGGSESDFIGPSAIRRLPGVGILVGRDSGEVDRRKATGGWSALPGSPAPYFVRTFANVGHGFFFGYASQLNYVGPRFAQWFPELGFCPAEDLLPSSTRYVVPLADGSLAVATIMNAGAPVEALILRAVEPAVRCSDLAP